MRQRSASYELCQIVDTVRGDAGASEEVRDALSALPGAMTIDAHMYLSADRDDDRRRVPNS